MRFPRRRRLLYLALILLVSALASVALILHRGERRLAEATARFERAFGALDAQAHAPADLPDDENAAYFIQQGTAALALTKADKSVLDDFLKHDHTVPGPTVRDLLARQGEALEHYRRAGGLDSSSFGIDYSAGVEAPLPMLMALLQGKKLLRADARAGLTDGDFERVFADSFGLAAIQRALENEPMIILQLIAMSVEVAHHQLIQDVLSSDLAEIALLDSLAGQLGDKPNARSNTRALQATFTVDAASMLSITAATAAESGTGWAVLHRIRERLSAPFETAAGVDFYYHLAKAAELPATRIGNYLGQNPPDDSVARILIPNLVSALERSRASIASHRAASLALSLRRHALLHGSYPESLVGFSRAAPPEPYADGAIVLDLHPDGAATLLMPDAVALWRDRMAHSSQPGPRFTWHLPSPHLPSPAPSEVGESDPIAEPETR